MVLYISYYVMYYMKPVTSFRMSNATREKFVEKCREQKVKPTTQVRRLVEEYVEA